jgi:hypothetical protein
VIVGGTDDAESAVIQTALEHRGMPATTVDARSLSTVGSVSVGLAGAGLIDSTDVYAEDVSVVWLGRHSQSLCGSAMDDLWDGLDAPILPALPCVLLRAMDKKRQNYSANEVGFATERRVNALDEISVAVVGDKVFAVSRRSNAVYALPRIQRGQCKSLLSLHGLECAVLEFAVTDTNDLVFRGFNPLGDYASIEHRSGLPVRRAIVDLLLSSNEILDTMDHYNVMTERKRKSAQRCHPANGRLKLVRS